MSQLLAYLEKLGPPLKKFDGNKPEVVIQTADGHVELSATNCRIYGPSVVFDSRYNNLGNWTSPRDRAEWTMEITRPDEYEVWLDYACENQSAGNVFALMIGDQTITEKVDGTGTWGNYQRKKIGVVRLQGATTKISFTALGELTSFLIELRSIRLEPTK